MSSRFSHPIISHSFSLAFQLFPSYLPDVVFRLSSNCIPSTLNLKPSLLDCKAELLVSGYWCPTRISLVRDLVSGFPFICLPLYLKGFVFGRQVVSVSLDVSLHLNGFICFPLWLVVSPFWVVLSGSPSVSLYVSSCMCLLFWLVVPLSECLLFALTWLPSFFLTICLPIHLSPNSCVFISLPYSGDVRFFPCFSLSVSHLICLPIHMSPLVGGVLFLFHRDFNCDWPLSLFFSPIMSCCCLSCCTSTDPR